MEMVKFIENFEEKVEYLNAVPFGTSISIESVCGGRTIKIGNPYPEKLGWKIDCMYFDQDMPPGKWYTENVACILVMQSDYDNAIRNKREEQERAARTIRRT